MWQYFWPHTGISKIWILSDSTSINSFKYYPRETVSTDEKAYFCKATYTDHLFFIKFYGKHSVYIFSYGNYVKMCLFGFRSFFFFKNSNNNAWF